MGRTNKHGFVEHVVVHHNTDTTKGLSVDLTQKKVDNGGILQLKVTLDYRNDIPGPELPGGCEKETLGEGSWQETACVRFQDPWLKKFKRKTMGPDILSQAKQE